MNFLLRSYIFFLLNWLHLVKGLLEERQSWKEYNTRILEYIYQKMVRFLSKTTSPNIPHRMFFWYFVFFILRSEWQKLFKENKIRLLLFYYF